MNNRLECQVDSCQHYSHGLCSLPSIRVEGPAAGDGRQTCCASFTERRGSVGNAVGGRPADEHSRIRCTARHCAYNNDLECRAERVFVSGSVAKVSTMGGTMCSTFLPE